MPKPVKWTFTLMIAALLFLANPYSPFGEFWPRVAARLAPTAFEMPFFLLLNALEAVALGYAIVMTIGEFPRKAFSKLTLRETRMGFVSLAWMLGNWWIHDGFHARYGDGNLTTLLYIEYAFHVTIMVAAFYVLYLFGRLLSLQKG